MKRIEYIMVTTWDGHWDKLNGGTYYTIPYVKDGIASGAFPAEATTLFIKRNKDTNNFEKSWIGSSRNFRKDTHNNKAVIRFDVSNLQEVTCPDELKKTPNGWYLNKNNISISTSAKPAAKTEDSLHPPFLKEMETCDWPTFERHCFHLLRLLGIHDIHAFPQDNNRGMADGIFHFHTLTVIYDATLEQNFSDSKATQMENYLNQLKKEKIKIGQQNYTIKNTLRQVWIITRGSNSQTIDREDDIEVKEIPFRKLVEVYDRRLRDEVGASDLQKILAGL